MQKLDFTFHDKKGFNDASLVDITTVYFESNNSSYVLVEIFPFKNKGFIECNVM